MGAARADAGTRKGRFTRAFWLAFAVPLLLPLGGAVTS